MNTLLQNGSIQSHVYYSMLITWSGHSSWEDVTSRGTRLKC
ncbi:hypothetical protein FOYG_16930 [Fusarium oxysporum NRRL 32931]|uniref:Uncharacterized protein n=1 Tax=Fusarium oxysporum NRRL 32931 TaxID=660029 RepID=W9HIJ8_FUSOX|nr:hypothetical protein FOYG_16930 [Fusarium oxysporum NRRL 32931]